MTKEMSSKERPMILFVDDEYANRLVFQSSFANLFPIRVVASGAEALEVLKNEPVALLVTDQRMPEMSGHDLLVRCKALYPDVVRVVITAHSDLDAILAAVNEGLVARYMVKPWDRVELEEVLRWGMAAFDLGRQDSILQLRLLQTERLSTIGTVTSAVLHDLNQPVANLLLNLEAIVELSAATPLINRLLDAPTKSLGAADSERLRALASELPVVVADVVLGAHMLRDLVGSLRRFLRPGPSRPGGPSSTDPLPIIHYAMRVSQETSIVARARVMYDGPVAVARVRMGATELSQVLINLVANATQALLVNKTGQGRVIVGAAEDGGVVRFWVEDNGPGMRPEVLARVGTPFFSTREEGTGLGISQCRRLVVAAGGMFEIKSQEDHGTIVLFTIPKA